MKIVKTKYSKSLFSLSRPLIDIKINFFYLYLLKLAKQICVGARVDLHDKEGMDICMYLNIPVDNASI